MERTRRARNPDRKEPGKLAGRGGRRAGKLVRAEKLHAQSTWPGRCGPFSQFCMGSSSELELPGSLFPSMKTAEEVCMADWIPPSSPHGNLIEKNSEGRPDSDPSAVSALSDRAVWHVGHVFSIPGMC